MFGYLYEILADMSTRPDRTPKTHLLTYAYRNTHTHAPLTCDFIFRSSGQGKESEPLGVSISCVNEVAAAAVLEVRAQRLISHISRIVYTIDDPLTLAHTTFAHV